MIRWGVLTVTKDGNLVGKYSYDISGTRLSETNTLRGLAGRTYSYSDEDHLLSAGSVTYVYDLDGFLTTKTDGSDITGYTYSSRGELLSVDLPDGRFIEYLHDPLSRRIAKKVGGVIAEKYLWQGFTRLLAVYDGADNLLMRFEYADDRLPPTMTTEGVTYYLTYDQVGSIRVVTDSSGNVVKRIDYDAFGNIIADTNPAFEVPFGFAGGLHDRDTGLVRFGYRDYDPDTGRWTAKDPILFAGGDTDLFGYLFNDPINWIDPLGLCDVENNSWLMSGLGVLALGALVADDATGVGVADDWLIPLVIGATGITALQSSEIRQADPNDLGPLKGAPGLGGWNLPTGDPHKDGPDYWKKPSNWKRMSKWQKAKWWAGKIGGALGSAGGVGR